MKNKYFAVLSVSVIITILSLIAMFFYVNMANDLSEKVMKLEQENQELRWINSQTTMYCEVE